MAKRAWNRAPKTICLGQCSKCCLAQLKCSPFQFLCHAQAKRFCQLCTVLGNILHSTHCQQICTIMNNIAFICTTLHIILTPQECCTLYICFGVQPMLCVAQYCVNPVFYSLAWNRMISPKIGVWSPKTGFVIMYIYCVLCFILSFKFSSITQPKRRAWSCDVTFPKI